MCTAMHTGNFFGRTLDLEYSYNETVTLTPRNFRFDLREAAESRFAILGMATVENGYPLYYDAMNENGLCMAGLNFPKSACYPPFCEGKINIATFELIPYILGKCQSVAEARALLEDIHIYDGSFSDEFPASPLHWMIADRERSIVLELTADGKNIYENAAGVLANEPPFPVMLEHLENFSALSADEPSVPCESRGEGALGLPGDWSSRSRFVRAAFAAKNTLPSNVENGVVTAFFRAIGTVEVPRGCVRLKDGKQVISHYTCCMDLSRGIYYYKTYEDTRIKAVALGADRNGEELLSYPLKTEAEILAEN